MIKYEKILVSKTEVIKAIFDDGSILFIPIDEANSDYQTYLKWVTESSTTKEIN